jgi:uncharacterized protein YegP (UPF0339 family)
MAGTFQIKKSSDAQYYFVLKGGNNEVIATSEMYTTKQSAQKGIRAIQTDAPGAEIKDLT